MLSARKRRRGGKGERRKAGVAASNCREVTSVCNSTISLSNAAPDYRGSRRKGKKRGKRREGKKPVAPVSPGHFSLLRHSDEHIRPKGREEGPPRQRYELTRLTRLPSSSGHEHLSAHGGPEEKGKREGREKRRTRPAYTPIWRYPSNRSEP